MGLLVGSLFSYSAWMFEGPVWLVAGLLAGSIIFGLLIELFTTVVFHEPQPAVTAITEPEMPRRAA